jgi:hypothetical protein
MSKINTSSLDNTFPIPGKNQSSQGFRDNFSSTKSNLDIAASEIFDLQNKSILKSALNDSLLSNDMANTLISNASIKSFRHTTKNLGLLSGTTIIDASEADAQYGSIIANTQLKFAKWAPMNTEQTIKLNIDFSANTTASLSFPNNTNNTLLENIKVQGNVATITAPANTDNLSLNITTTDCGNTLIVTPENRNFKSTQIDQRIILPTGIQGDTNGSIAISLPISQSSITSLNTSSVLTTNNTSSLYIDMPIIFSGNILDVNIIAGNIYYVKSILSNTTFTVSATVGGPNLTISANSTGNMLVNPVSSLYLCTNDYNSVTYTKTIQNTFTIGNILQLNNTTNLTVNSPMTLIGNTDVINTKLKTDTVYYIKTISSSNVTVSLSRTNGIADSTFVPGNKTNANISATIHVGSDIWKKINLVNW